jgi:NAD(P)-dependent dehydrogenase (short-subunit alcohol dehydrogenase family)
MSSEMFLGRTVLVTGGTRGLGKAIGMEFARQGATVFLTHRWGSVEDEELVAEFRAAGLSEPIVAECDASDRQANRELMGLIRKTSGQLDVLVNNVAFSKVIHGLDDLKKVTLDLSLGYSAWPLVDLVQASHEVIGTFPRYVLGISSDGAMLCHEGYELAGASKAVLETLCRYLALRLKQHGVRVNAVRPGYLDTQSSRATFGDAMIDKAMAAVDGLFINPHGVAKVCVALCSGLMDAVTGQVIVVDEGWSVVSPLAFVTEEGLPGRMPQEAELS